MDFKKFSAEIHENNKAKGFWPRFDEDEVIKKLTLIHCEISEAVEALRDAGSLEEALKYKTYLDKFNKDKPECFSTELADVAIRLFDLAFALGLDLEDLMYKKHQYNLTRPHKHGKSF